MRYILIILLSWSLFFINTPVSLSETVQHDFSFYILIWQKKIDKAGTLLKLAENELKLGSYKKACMNQRQARDYAIEAYQALIEAVLLSETQINLDIYKNNLEKWKALNTCKNINLPNLEQISTYSEAETR